MKNKVLLVLLTGLLMAAGTQMIGTKNASAASGCALLARATSASGNCLEGQDYTNSALTNMLPSDSSSELKTDLIDRLTTFLKTGQGFQKIGAKYIICKLANNADNNIGSDCANQAYSSSQETRLLDALNAVIDQPRIRIDVDDGVWFSSNTMYVPLAGPNWVQKYSQSDTTRAAKIYYDPYGSGGEFLLMKIKLDCGNPLDEVSDPPPNPPKLRSNSTVSNSTAVRNQKVTFYHSIRNTSKGSQTAYKWQVTMNVDDANSQNVSNGGSHNGTFSGSETGVPPDATRPNPYNSSNGRDVFTIPNSAPIGRKYCERIKYSNGDGKSFNDLDTLDSFSNGYVTACVTVVGGPPPGGSLGSGWCTGASMPTSGSGTVAKWTGDPPGSAIPAGGTAWKTSLKSSDGWGTVHYVTASDAKGDLYPTVSVSDGNSWSGTYTPRSAKVTVVLEYKAHVAYGLPGGGTAWTWYNYQPTTTTTYTCYAATCQILSVEGTGPNNIALAGGTATLIAQISHSNTGEMPVLPESMPNGDKLGLTYSGASDQPDHPLGGPLGSGESDTIRIPINVSATGTSQTISGMYPDYYGTGSIGANCPDFAFPIYTFFSLTPHANISATDPEDITSITYTTGGTLASGGNQTVNITSWLTEDDLTSGAAPTTINGPTTYSRTYSGSPDDTFTWVRPASNPQKPGFQYCAFASLSPASGYLSGSSYIAPDGSTTANSITVSSPGCVNSVNMPYTHVVGGDVIAGMGFGQGTCTPMGGTDASIRTYTKTTGTGARGSGTQFAAIAMNRSEGFSSANIRNMLAPLNGPYASDGLTFSNTFTPALANDGSQVGSDHAKKTGGNYGVSDTCIMPDYMSKMPPGATTWTATSSLGQANTTKSYKNTDPSVAITLGGTTTISNGSNNAIYTAGDVFINGDIRYTGASGGSWNSVKDIPSLLIVARNIYVAPGVKQLDGMFVAQGTNGGSNGIIDTCVVGTFTACRNQLVINGVFVAKKVYLNRTYSSLRHSVPGESLRYGSNHSCNGAIDTNPGDTTAKDCAAEIFNISPEMYLAQPAMNITDQGKWQAYSSLSPVL